MHSANGKKVSRRDFIRLAATTTAIGPFFVFPGRALAQRNTLKIAQWSHFLPEYDTWFDEYAKEWGNQHSANVVVDHIPVEKVHSQASAEIAVRRGHDLSVFPWPPAEFQQHAIDHTEICRAVSFRHGNISSFGNKSTFDPKTKKYFAFADSWMPTPFLYFADEWRQVNMQLGPVHYDSLLSGGERLRTKLGIPCGLALAPTLDGNVTLHTLLYAFGSGVLNTAGDVIIDQDARTLAALEYVKTLCQNAGTPEQLAWGLSGNARAMVARKTSCTMNGISLLRTAEKENPEVAKKIMLQPPLLGHIGVLSVPQVTNCSVIWSFAENKDAAKQFLIDLVDNSRTVYEKSKGSYYPMYQNTVPNLIVRLEKDPQASPRGKYDELKDALYWTRQVGFPGHANPVAMEVFNTFVIPRMFMSVVKDELSPEDAAHAAGIEVKRISKKWNQS